MKKEEIPQDKSALENFSHELCYAKNEKGEYDTALSKGWEVKASALDNAWDEIHEKIADAKKIVEKGKKSPIYFHMVKNLMDISILSSYVKFSKLRVKWHLRPSIYKKMKHETRAQYAKVFNISVEKLNILD